MLSLFLFFFFFFFNGSGHFMLFSRSVSYTNLKRKWHIWCCQESCNSMALPVLTKEKILYLNSSPPFDVTVTKIKVDYVTQ